MSGCCDKPTYESRLNADIAGGVKEASTRMLNEIDGQHIATTALIK